MEAAKQVQSYDTELVLGYTPAFWASRGEWQHVFRQDRRAPDGGVFRRVVFDNIADPHSRVLVDVVECPTSTEARAKLAAARADANFVTTDAPTQFGANAFAYPEVDARSLYFCRSNLMIWAHSLGRTPVLITPWTERVLGDLDAELTAEAGSDLTLAPAPNETLPSNTVRLLATSRWHRGEWAWWKFKTSGGSLARSREDDSILFRPSAADAQVTCWVVEPGRPTYAGRFGLPKEAR